mgnify:FL=1
MKGNLVLVVRQPDEELRSVGERETLGGADLAGELQRVEFPHVADFLHLAPLEAVAQMADRIFEHHLQDTLLADAERRCVGAAHVEKERHGVHAHVGERHLLPVFGQRAPLPAGRHAPRRPVVVEPAAEGIAPFVDIARESHGAQRRGIDPDVVPVVEREEPPERGQRLALSEDVIDGLSVEFDLGGTHHDGSHLRIGHQLGAVADTVEQLFAGHVDLSRGGEYASRQQKKYEDSFHRKLFHLSFTVFVKPSAEPRLRELCRGEKTKKKIHRFR